MVKLKPCPFCGGEAVFVTRSVGYGRRCAIFNFEISCKSCLAKAPEAYGSIEIYLDQNGEVAMYKDERSKAIEAWNRRAEPDQEWRYNDQNN